VPERAGAQPWEAGYVQAVAYVEARGEQLEAEAAALEKTATACRLARARITRTGRRA
jgi:hypothetical protein